MAASSRFTPPLSTPNRDQNPDVRNRQRSATPQSGPAQPSSLNASPASSATASTTGGNTLDLSRALDRPSLRLSSLQLAHSTSTLNSGAPARKLVVRSDPSIVTCFDPADKELYDLWAPKR